MIRERRNKTKLEQYYNKFIQEQIIDPNVHPWVAESWQRCQCMGLKTDKILPKEKLSKADLTAKQDMHKNVIDYLEGLYKSTREHFNNYNLSLLLVDKDSYVLRNFALPFYHRTLEDVEGARVREDDIGTFSISITLEHKVPFLLFGPEMWIAECHTGDACAVPITVNGQVQFVVSVFSIHQEELPYNAIVAWMLSVKYALEVFLQTEHQMKALHEMVNILPLTVFHVRPDGEVLFANEEGKKRLGTANNLNEAVLNYRHIPLQKGFVGVPTYNKEITWLTADKAYEDLTTVIPIKWAQKVDSIIAVSIAIEDLKTMLAHATGYSSRYSLSSLVGLSEEFQMMIAKASRVAKSDNPILLQGESGTGKQRIAHGIHQASSRAAEPLISVKCGDVPEEKFELELFGLQASNGQTFQGKIELANQGTIFIDEIEKMPLAAANKLAGIFKDKKMTIGTEVKTIDVRFVAACDSNLKRLTDKGLFSPSLYELLAKNSIRIVPLRERQDDIPLLAKHIVAEIAEQHSIAGKTLTPEAMYMLQQFTWPGNIKQLQGVLERAFFHSSSDVINGNDIHIPKEYRHSREWKQSKEAFIEAWRSAGGNISRLATMLNVSRVTLYRYLRKYELDRIGEDEEKQ